MPHNFLEEKQKTKKNTVISILSNRGYLDKYRMIQYIMFVWFVYLFKEYFIGQYFK